MRVRIQVVVESDPGDPPVVQEVATLERGPLQPDGLGLTLAEAKALLHGVAPSLALQTHAAALRPALALKARVSLVKEVDAGEGVSYGLRFRADRPTVINQLRNATAQLGTELALSALGMKIL